MKTALILLVLVAQQTGANSSTKAPADKAKAEAKFTERGHTVDSPQTVLKRLKKKEAVLIDVREESEWAQGHLQQAELVPLSAVRENKLTKEMEKALPKDKPIYCHCRSGGRVLAFSKILREKGYDIRPLKLGYTKLLEAGFKKAQDKKQQPNQPASK